MDIQIDERIVRRLEEAAQEQQRDVNAIVQEAIELYFARQAEEKQLRADVRRVMQEHEWLLNELAKK